MPQWAARGPPRCTSGPPGVRPPSRWTRSSRTLPSTSPTSSSSGSPLRWRRTSEGHLDAAGEKRLLELDVGKHAILILDRLFFSNRRDAPAPSSNTPTRLDAGLADPRTAPVVYKEVHMQDYLALLLADSSCLPLEGVEHDF